MAAHNFGLSMPHGHASERVTTKPEYPHFLPMSDQLGPMAACMAGPCLIP